MKSSVYKRPNKPKFLNVDKTRRSDLIDAPNAEALKVNEPITVDRATECHVTPSDVAQRMVDWLDACPDHHVIEPSAGNGALVSALLDSGHVADRITAVERHLTLVNALHDRFSDVSLCGIHSDCFLEFVSKADASNQPDFQRALLNPPFRKTKAHINATIHLLSQSPTGDWALVALVPITFNHPDAELLEILPNDTFSLAKVNTKIIRIES